MKMYKFIDFTVEYLIYAELRSDYDYRMKAYGVLNTLRLMACEPESKSNRLSLSINHLETLTNERSIFIYRCLEKLQDIGAISYKIDIDEFNFEFKNITFGGDE